MYFKVKFLLSSHMLLVASLVDPLAGCLIQVRLSSKRHFCFQSDHFPFLGISAGNSPMADMRCRTTFYTALGRLLMVDLGEDEERFEQFMRPLEGGFFLKLFIYFRPIAKKVITTYIIHS